VVSNVANAFPDMEFDNILVASGRIIVRGEVTGPPSGESFGVAHSGRSFRIMARRHPDHARRQNRKDLPHEELAERDRATARQIAAGFTSVRCFWADFTGGKRRSAARLSRI
jgi:hypothetical protein